MPWKTWRSAPWLAITDCASAIAGAYAHRYATAQAVVDSEFTSKWFTASD